MTVWVVYPQYLENGVAVVCATEEVAKREAVRIVTEFDPEGPQASLDVQDSWGGLAFIAEFEVLES